MFYFSEKYFITNNKPEKSTQNYSTSYKML